MITREELQRKAAQAGVRVQMQERDYALGSASSYESVVNDLEDLLGWL